MTDSPENVSSMSIARGGHADRVAPRIQQRWTQDVDGQRQHDAARAATVPVTGAMFNDIVAQAVRIQEQDLSDMVVRDKHPHAESRQMARYDVRISQAVRKATRAIINEAPGGYPTNCKDLADLLRDPECIKKMHSALLDTDCPPQYHAYLLDNFGKMMRKLAKETEQSCGAGAAR